MIKKAILPVAGLGTRCLPATKSIPKEMLPIVDRPVIEYVVKEAVAAGIEQIILVTHSSKTAIENYFDHNFELESNLSSKNKWDLLKEIQSIVPDHVSFISIRQSQPLGLGHAVLCAKDIIGEDDFVVLLPDVIVHHHDHFCDLRQMIENYQLSHQAQIMVEQVPHHQVSLYGIVDINSSISEKHSAAIQGIIEKPYPDEAPSNLAVVGRYVLPARIMSLLEKTGQGAGGEIQLTDAISALIQQEIVAAYLMQGKVFDCGSKQGYLNAILNFAYHHPILGAEFKKNIQKLVEKT